MLRALAPLMAARASSVLAGPRPASPPLSACLRTVPGTAEREGPRARGVGLAGPRAPPSGRRTSVPGTGDTGAGDTGAGDTGAGDTPFCVR
ncbi:hypothetical protein EYF80_061141 [Liparis tanakae]|uniref:Uncharacterized protein n=1 Tax=Liparis tanakae TaxID=230148 RepID=A0A4Z2EIT1_9TELE|nr:hypothetical protein EYF80_061141 [Liparis tanakae]